MIIKKNGVNIACPSHGIITISTACNALHSAAPPKDWRIFRIFGKTCFPCHICYHYFNNRSNTTTSKNKFRSQINQTCWCFVWVFFYWFLCSNVGLIWHQNIRGRKMNIRTSRGCIVNSFPEFPSIYCPNMTAMKHKSVVKPLCFCTISKSLHASS